MKRVNRFTWKQENKFKTPHWKWGITWKCTLTFPTGLLRWRPGGSQPGSHPPERSWQAVISNFITHKSRQSKTMTFQTIATETKRRTHTQKRIWKKNWENSTRRKHRGGRRKPTHPQWENRRYYIKEQDTTFKSSENRIELRDEV